MRDAAKATLLAEIARLSVKVKSLDGRITDERSEFYVLMRKARKAGIKLHVIGKAAGLSTMRVSDITREKRIP